MNVSLNKIRLNQQFVAMATEMQRRIETSLLVSQVYCQRHFTLAPNSFQSYPIKTNQCNQPGSVIHSSQWPQNEDGRLHR
jgi:hypothetical protein